MQYNFPVFPYNDFSEDWQDTIDTQYQLYLVSN
jgi:hypothetical protein